jgi:hypothetical protein
MNGIYLMHIHAAIAVLLEAWRLNADGKPLVGAVAAVQNLSIAAEEAGKAFRLLHLNPTLTPEEGGQS